MYVCVCVLFFFISGSCGGEENATKKKKESSFLVCILRPINSTICCGCLFFFPLLRRVTALQLFDDVLLPLLHRLHVTLLYSFFFHPPFLGIASSL